VSRAAATRKFFFCLEILPLELFGARPAPIPAWFLLPAQFFGRISASAREQSDSHLYSVRTALARWPGSHFPAGFASEVFDLRGFVRLSRQVARFNSARSGSDPCFLSLVVVPCILFPLLIEDGLIFKPSDQRLKLSSFSLCFAHGLLITLISCSMKCLRDSKNAFDLSFAAVCALGALLAPIRAFRYDFKLSNPTPGASSFSIGLWS
jgi:hypothetical protein